MDNLQTPITMCLSKVTLAAGTTTTISNTGTTVFCIKGKAYSKAAMSNAATPTTDAATGSAFVAVAASKGCIHVVGLDSSGAVKVVQGNIESLTTEADGANASFIKAPTFPVLPDTVCPIGYIVTKVGASGSSWTFGSSNLAGPPSNVLHTFVDICMIPGRPQVS